MSESEARSRTTHPKPAGRSSEAVVEALCAFGVLDAKWKTERDGKEKARAIANALRDVDVFMAIVHRFERATPAYAAAYAFVLSTGFRIDGAGHAALDAYSHTRDALDLMHAKLAADLPRIGARERRGGCARCAPRDADDEVAPTALCRACRRELRAIERERNDRYRALRGWEPRTDCVVCGAAIEVEDDTLFCAPICAAAYDATVKAGTPKDDDETS